MDSGILSTRAVGSASRTFEGPMAGENQAFLQDLMSVGKIECQGSKYRFASLPAFQYWALQQPEYFVEEYQTLVVWWRLCFSLIV
jgi:hypothetical protein